jgi:hypothetical protein
MDAAIRRLIEAIHQTGHQCVLALTGGGTTAAAQLLSVPGGSRTILEVVVPYDAAALVDFLGRRPLQFCSAETSRDMAARAYARARWLAPGEQAVGIGCSASLATDRPKRGDHRFHVSAVLADRTLSHSLTLHKGARDREAEEVVLDAFLLNALAEATGVADRLTAALLPDEVVSAESVPASNPLAELLRGDLPAVCVQSDGQLSPNAPKPKTVLPGAFNPVHEGHRRLAETGGRLLGTPVDFELSAANVDKPPLHLEEVHRRLAQFTWWARIWVTSAPTFAEKASLFPGAVFVVGADTAERIVAPRYYHNSEAEMCQALDRIRARGCRFLVAGRDDAEGRFIGYEELALPKGHCDLFVPLSKSDFHVPISSTTLRAQGQEAAAVAPPDERE